MRAATRSALTALAIGTALFANAGAHAQVQLFEEVPSVEQLRSILIPESTPSASRRIIINAPKPQLVQPAALTLPGAAAIAPQTQPSTPALPAVAEAPAAEAAAAPPPPPATTEVAAAPAKPAHRKAEKKLAKAGIATAVGFRINFAFNSAVIPADSDPYLDKIAALLGEEKTLVLAVEGHTDAVGGVEYNLELSRQRAEAVTHYLVEHGVAPKQLVPVGKGKSEPLVTDPFDGRNRRVQFDRINESAS